MSQRDAFVRQIIDEPDDDAPRLVFADWLDDHGESDRAEFIRTQVRRAALDPDDPAQSELQAREWRLLLANAREWLGEDFDGPATNFRQFRRGFVERVRLTPKALLDRGDALFGSQPISDLDLARPSQALLVRESPHLARLRRLCLSRADEDGVSAEVPLSLLRSPHLSGLRALGLARVPVGGHLRQLVALPSVRALTELDLFRSGCCDEDLSALFDLPLTALDLADTGVSAAGLATLAASPLAERLTRLDLSGLWLRGEEAVVTDLLERAPLQSLTISDSGLASFDALLAVRAWPGPLRQLRVCRVSPDLARWRAFFAHPLLAGLTSLWLDAVDLPPGAITELAGSPHLAGLRSLHLDPQFERAASSDEITRLVGSPALDGLTSLTLTPISLADDDALALIRSPQLHRLRRLRLCTVLGMPAVCAIAEEGPPALTSLTIEVAGQDEDEAVATLASAPRLPWLTYLHLGSPVLTERGMRPLLEGPPRLCLGNLAPWMKDAHLVSAYRDRFGAVDWGEQLPDATAVL